MALMDIDVEEESGAAASSAPSTPVHQATSLPELNTTVLPSNGQVYRHI